jgi:antitoxin ParD1/3/4
MLIMPQPQALKHLSSEHLLRRRLGRTRQARQEQQYRGACASVLLGGIDPRDRRFPMTVKTSISLTDEQEAYARSLVERGRYSSLSAVLQHGLDMLRRDNELHASKIQALQELIDQRRAGPFVPLDDKVDDFLAAVDRED